MIGLNTEKNSEDLKRLFVIQTPTEKHHLTLVRKTLKWVIIIYTGLCHLLLTSAKFCLRSRIFVTL